MKKNMEADQKFVEEVVKAIVNNPDKVKTSRIIDERGVLITLDVDPSDMGYVIGRSGQTARALRVLLKIVGAKNNARVNLKINEPEGGRGPGRGPMMGANSMGGNMGNMNAPMSSTMSDPIDTSAIDNLGI